MLVCRPLTLTFQLNPPPAGTQDFVFLEGKMGIGWGGDQDGRHFTRVTEVVAGTQAEELGVQPGDTLVAINEEAVARDISMEGLMNQVLTAGRPCTLCSRPRPAGERVARSDSGRSEPQANENCRAAHGRQRPVGAPTRRRSPPSTGTAS